MVFLFIRIFFLIFKKILEENETEKAQKEQQTTTDLMREKCSTPERLPVSGGVSNCGSNLRKV